MKRRIRWPSWLTGRAWSRHQAAPRPVEQPAAPNPMPYRVLLRFRDGSSEILDPRTPIALEFHAIADQWLTGRR